MSRSLRPAVGLVLLAGLAAPARAAEVDPLLPAQTESVVFVNVRQILDSELIKKFARGQIEQALKGKDAQKMLADLGLDPLKDIDRVTLGTWGTSADDVKAVGVVRGRFDLDKLFKAAEDAATKDKDKVEIVTEGKYKLVKYTGDEKQKQPVYLSGVDGTTLVASNDKALVAATRDAAAAAGGTKVALKADLVGLVAAQDDKASVFACGLADGKKVDLPPGVNLPGVDPAKLAKQLAGLRTMALTIRLTDGVSLDVGLGMKDPDTADDLGDTLSQLVGFAKTALPLVAGNQPSMKPLADEVGANLKSKVKDKDVRLTLKVSGAAIGKVVEGGDDKDK